MSYAALFAFASAIAACAALADGSFAAATTYAFEAASAPDPMEAKSSMPGFFECPTARRAKTRARQTRAISQVWLGSNKEKKKQSKSLALLSNDHHRKPAQKHTHAQLPCGCGTFPTPALAQEQAGPKKLI